MVESACTGSSWDKNSRKDYLPTERKGLMQSITKGASEIVQVSIIIQSILPARVSSVLYYDDSEQNNMTMLSTFVIGVN